MGKNSKDIPDRWLDYVPIGLVIAGTKIIAFKVPLKTNICQRNLPEDEWFTPAMLMERQPKLKTIIDLTNTFRYYNGQEEFGTKGIDHVKIMVEGLRDRMPTVSKLQEFFDAMDRHMEKYRDSTDALIGIHCTHGLNRTGYFVCKWMLERMKITPDDAIQRFNSARGHTIERKHLLNDLKINNPLPTLISLPPPKTNNYRSPLDDPSYDETSRDNRYGRYRGSDMSSGREGFNRSGSSRREYSYDGGSGGRRISRMEHPYSRGPAEGGNSAREVVANGVRSSRREHPRVEGPGGGRSSDREHSYQSPSNRYRGDRDISAGNSHRGLPRTHQRHADSERRNSTVKRSDGPSRADLDMNWKSRGLEEGTRGGEQRNFRDFRGDGRKERNESAKNRSPLKTN